MIITHCAYRVLYILQHFFERERERENLQKMGLFCILELK